VKPAQVKNFQMRFLTVFWLIRMADWLQGPYFYEVYSSKMFDGVQASLGLVSKIFLVGFASTGLFGPWIGKFVDSVGRKAGTLAFTALYTVGALSTRSSFLNILLLGRLAGGIGTSLLFSAPEAWMVGEFSKNKFDGKWLGETFGLAYAGDAIVAIVAGVLASASASKLGPTGPFTISVGFLISGALVTLFNWKENTAASVAAAISSEKEDAQDAPQSGKDAETSPNVKDALSMMVKDKRIPLVGGVQALFEAAMYIFVLQWPPAMKAAIEATSRYGVGATTPYGIIFSCFMTSCLIGSTAFGAFQSKNVSIETSTLLMLILATSAISAATLFSGSSLAVLTLAFFLFEVCVGMYFPSIGSLRAKYLPDSHRSVLINLFGVPLNLLVVTVFLFIGKLGVNGALLCSSSALGVATLCMWMLSRKAKKAAA
jgi:MFS family permease